MMVLKPLDINATMRSSSSCLRRHRAVLRILQDRISQLFGTICRGILRRLGYLLIKKKYVRFGYSLFVDVSRVSSEWNWNIETVFDVGANYGQFASEVLTEFSAARVYSFEPFGPSYERLVNSSQSKRFVPNKIALSNMGGEIPFYVYSNDGDGSMINSVVPDAQYPKKFGYEPKLTTVPCKTASEFCEENSIERIDLLKIDTEGSEMLVLDGATRLFQERRIRFVYLEFNSLLKSKGSTGGALVEVAEFLQEFGFEYLVTYTDYVIRDHKIHVCANALFVCGPDQTINDA